jgi:DNA-binding transcriptional ArsR family regulator
LTINEPEQAIEELDKTIRSLVELRKHLAAKSDYRKSISSMKEFLDMLRKQMPSFQTVVDELERFRQENGFDGVVLSAGLYGVDDPPTNVWWTVVNPVDMLMTKKIDVTGLIDILSNQNRLRLLKFLTTGSKTYTEISDHLQIRGGGFAHHAIPLLRMKCISKKERGTYQITELGWEVLLTILSLSTRINRSSR